MKSKKTETILNAGKSVKNYSSKKIAQLNKNQVCYFQHLPIAGMQL